MPTEDASEIEERDSELENSVGIIFVADCQINKATKRLAHKIHPYIPVYHRKTRHSIHIHEQDGIRYRIFLEVEDLSSRNMTNAEKMQGFQSIFGKVLLKSRAI